MPNEMGKAGRRSGAQALLRLRDAAVQLQISYPTIKQWIYHSKLHAVKTPGGHYRIPQAEVDRLLYRLRQAVGIFEHESIELLFARFR